jgi:hypothetical protein
MTEIGPRGRVSPVAAPRTTASWVPSRDPFGSAASAERADSRSAFACVMAAWKTPIAAVSWSMAVADVRSVSDAARAACPVSPLSSDAARSTVARSGRRLCSCGRFACDQSPT